MIVVPNHHKNRHLFAAVVLRLLLRLAAISWIAAAVVSGEPRDDPCGNNPGVFDVGDGTGTTDTCENLAGMKWRKRDRKCGKTSLSYAEECPGICHVVDDERNCACADIPHVLNRKGWTCERLAGKPPGDRERLCSTKNVLRNGCPGTCDEACSASAVPSAVPSAAPTTAVSSPPTTAGPTAGPSETPTTVSPTAGPSETPTAAPSAGPTQQQQQQTPSPSPGEGDSSSNSNNILENGGFEDDTMDPWKARGGTTIERSTEHAFSGDHGGLVTGRTATWHGIDQEIIGVVEPGVIYEFSAWARLVASGDGVDAVDAEDEEELRFKVHEKYTITTTTPEGVVEEEYQNSYVSVARDQLDLTGGWMKLTGSYRIDDDDDDIQDGRVCTSRKLYVEGSGTSSFAIDEVVLRDALPVPDDDDGVYVSADDNTERVVLPRPPGTDRTVPPPDRTNCPHLVTPGLVPWESLFSSDDPLSPGSDVVLPENTAVLISATVETPLGLLVIPESSSLVFGEDDGGDNDNDSNGIFLDVTGIEVGGSLIAGSETCRYETSLTITLHGSRPATNETPYDPSYKGISVTGRIDLHGKRYHQTWTR